MADKQPSKWNRLPKMSFTSKDLSRRMKKVEGATMKHARRFVFRRIGSMREVRRHIGLWVLTIGVLIAASGVQLFWYQQSYRATAAASDGTYAEGVLGPIDTLNPIFARTSAEESASALMFSRLLSYDTSGALNYDLVESFTLSEDQRTYTATIRPDARWHDGRYVRAVDVVFTVNLLKNPSTRSTISGWNDIAVAATGDRTVEFRLPAVYAAFPHALNFLPILPEHALRDIEPSALRENNFSNNPIGSGPFSLRFIQDVEQSEGNRKIIHMARNDSYYKGSAKLERFQLHVYSNRDAISRALTLSEVNAATDISVTDAENVNTERYTVERRPISSGVYSLFNTTTGVLSDVKVRQALQAVTDTQKIRDVVGEGTPELYLPFIDEQVSGALPGAPEQNSERAAQLLDEAGWVLQNGVRTKDGANLTLKVVTTNNNDLERVLEEIRTQWRALGITVTTSIVDPSDPAQNVAQNILQRRNYDVLIYQLTIGGDPDVYAYWHSSQASRGFNFANYSSSISDDALTSARTTVGKELRDAKYVTFAEQWLSDAPAIGLYQSTAQYVASKRVNTNPAPGEDVSSIERYADVLYWTVGERIVQRTP